MERKFLRKYFGRTQYLRYILKHSKKKIETTKSIKKIYSIFKFFSYIMQIVSVFSSLPPAKNLQKVEVHVLKLYDKKI